MRYHLLNPQRSSSLLGSITLYLQSQEKQNQSIDIKSRNQQAQMIEKYFFKMCTLVGATQTLGSLPHLVAQ